MVIIKRYTEVIYKLISSFYVSFYEILLHCLSQIMTRSYFHVWFLVVIIEPWFSYFSNVSNCTFEGKMERKKKSLPCKSLFENLIFFF